MAFNALLASVDPERRDRVRRHGIKLLLENDYRGIGSRKDPDAGAPIRAQLRAVMQTHKLTAMMVATEIGLSESAIDKASAPNGPVPSAVTIGLGL